MKDGAFLIAGLRPGDYKIESATKGWIVSPPTVAAAGSQSLLVTVIRSASLVVSVRENGVPISGYRTYVALSVNGSSVSGSRDVHEVVTTAVSGDCELELDLPRLFPQSQGDPMTRLLTAKYRITAQGYPEVHGVVEFVPETGPGMILVDLREEGKSLFPLTVDVAYDDGPLEPDKELALTYSAPDSRRSVTVPLNRLNGQWIAKLPSGRWFVHIRPIGLLSWANASPQEVLIESSNAELLNVRFRRGGTLRIRSTVPESMPAVLEGVKFSTDLQVMPSGLIVKDVPEGEWVVRWNALGIERTASAVVTRGGIAELAITR